MQSDSGKLFIGGISWDTNEECLKEYFSNFGEVVEAVIMKDRNTGRARGFGFVVFADPAVAERVIKEKHNINGRMVEAKKAVPRDDQNIINRSANSSSQGSPGPCPGRTRKIFVGGLASSVTESDFRNYFEQFGTITDVVVMYDQNTQRPRGFGFITYDSEEAVDKALLKTFHELNGKMVEVKRAVPKELSPSPSPSPGRSPLGGYNSGMMSRNNSLLNGYNPGIVGGYGLRMDGRFSPVAGSRSGFAMFGSGDGMGVNFEPGLIASGYGGTANFTNNAGYGRSVTPYYVGNSNRIGSSVGYEGANGGNSSFFSSVTRNLWGNGGGLSYNTGNSNSGPSTGLGNGNSNGLSWGGFSALSGRGGGNDLPNSTMNFGYGGGDNSFPYARNNGTNMANGGGRGGYDSAAIANFYSSSSNYGEPDWRSSLPEKETFPGSLTYGLNDASAESSPSYVGGFTVNKRQPNGGIAA
ncbi:PREDICTED: heterogeneous nuclear ribonucleoprotein 1-like [Tarenaya hassleriana]|uniref:heterogeneous nuclear ribonucleoprotein 1-like n=1 Tax=Tarenaya hassleriana TaxID=28532 RepID=UPI00053C9E55|nr:PREDICTED: heterogeneous nuclear ribonucleoprotein 1-like [Tarenaya hassleriana]XP_019059696.1 PREDICTED: heterogeneous nuclear ribonucleoprotein 1-like [Tarenaya hassleriana]